MAKEDKRKTEPKTAEQKPNDNTSFNETEFFKFQRFDRNK